MKTLQSHNEEMEKKFVGNFVVVNGDGTHELDYRDIKKIKNFITSQNKQLYIKIVEEELERLRKSLAGYTAHYRNQVIQESIDYWNNILQELNK